MSNPRYLYLYSKTTQDNARRPSRRASVGGTKAVPLNWGWPFPESFPNEEIASALKQALELEPDKILQYSAGLVARSLVTWLVQRAATRGMTVSEDQVVVTNGASQALDLVCRVLLDRGDVIMSEAPTFMGALRSFQNFTVTCLGFAMDEEGVLTADIEKELNRRRENGQTMPKFFYTIPNFQNPTGVTMSRGRRLELLRLAAEYNFLVLEDDAYGELRWEGEAVPTLWELDTDGSVIHVGTFSKLIGPGVRTGWVFAPEELAAQVSRLKAGGTNGLSQSTVAQYCNSVDFDGRVQWLRDNYSHRCGVMLDALDEYMPEGVRWTKPKGGFFVWVELPEYVNAAELSSVAMEKGVGYLSGGMFFPDGTGNHCLRLAFCYPPDEEIERGIKVLGEVVSEAL